jgi:cysteine synthase A
MNVAQNIGDLIGNTPLIKLNNIDKNLPGNIYAKCEFMNPTSSVKDRIGLSMIKSALDSGKITKNTHIVEPTSGNTGIALASICANFGLKLTLTMPESMSIERRKLLAALGANLVLTPKEFGMKGAIAKANEIVENEPDSIILQQFENPANPLIHTKTTAIEILRDMDEKIDIFVAAVGTGGTLSGTSSVLKNVISSLKVIAVEPTESAVISGNPPAPHRIQGIGAGFVPKNLNVSLIDEIITVNADDAYETARFVAKNEGLLVGISAGANVFAAISEASKEENRGKNIVTILCDTGERYLSNDLY